MSSEAVLQRAIIGALEAAGVLVWQNTCGRRGLVRMGLHSKGHPTGSSDLIACHRGRFFAFEVKCPGGETKGCGARLAAQQKFRDDVRAHGGVATVVTSPAQALAAIDIW